jgi:uncharacterized membrane protein YkoI
MVIIKIRPLHYSMETITNSRKLVSKKVLIPAIAGVGILLSTIFITTSSFENSWAQQQQQTVTNNTTVHEYSAMPKINGSVSVGEAIKNFLEENAKISFLTAAQTAQNQIANGTVLGGHLGATQGYLTYTYIIVDSAKDSVYKVIIDAGNGHVIYTSEGQQIGSFGQTMFGPFEHGKGHGGFNGVGPFRHGGFGGSGFWHGR